MMGVPDAINTNEQQRRGRQWPPNAIYLILLEPVGVR